MASANVRIPEKFMGTFKLDRSENFDEFLASKGVNWFVRKMIGFSSVTKVFGVSKNDPDAYDMSNLSSKKNTHFNNWKLNQTFESEGLDSKMHKITFNFDEGTDTLKETHVRMDDPNDKGETYYYTVEGDELVMMRSVIALLLVVLVAALEAHAKTLPDKFLGTFKLEKDENFDEYLKERGYGWIMRQVIKLAGVTKKFSKSTSGKPDRYDMENLTTKKDTHHKDWALGEEFVDEALDSTQHKITFDLKDPNTLTEKHVKVADPADVETYEYRREGDYLVMITFDLKDPNTLTEKHVKVADPADVETYEYRREGDYLVMKMTWNGVSTNRYYKKQ
ncbi:Fatty acid-binding -like protein [Toxocara canis]|uniref:Fatty acid-binding-like protein n=1 Tax=Toxocara canis TaxID=6265 RepID=A0A0B2UZW6_TOXCA|nr:Fatty acid-binding -like protein [Toxocara canis]